LNPRPQNSGQDLMTMHKPTAPCYGENQERVREAQLNGELQDAQQARQWAQQWWDAFCQSGPAALDGE
jgi:hypothetical protein